MRVTLGCSRYTREKFSHNEQWTLGPEWVDGMAGVVCEGRPVRDVANDGHVPSCTGVSSYERSRPRGAVTAAMPDAFAAQLVSPCGKAEVPVGQTPCGGLIRPSFSPCLSGVPSASLPSCPPNLSLSARRTKPRQPSLSRFPCGRSAAPWWIGRGCTDTFSLN